MRFRLSGRYQVAVSFLEALERADISPLRLPGGIFGRKSMLDSPELKAFARRIFEHRMPTGSLEYVITKETTSSDGEAALRITLVITPETVDSISGEEVLKLLVDIQDGLMREGEERLPIIDYATRGDLVERDIEDDEE